MGASDRRKMVKMDDSRLKTGTTTIGLVCKDGIVLAADRRATMGSMIATKKAQKVYIIKPNMAVTIAGTVSDIQMIIKLIKAELSLKEIRTNREAGIKEAANLLAGIVYANIRKMSLIPGVSQFLLGGKDESGFHLFNIFVDGSLEEIDDFVSSGSGSVFAYGVFESSYNKENSVEEGIKLAVKAINSALQRDTGSGNGIDVITITDKGVKKVYEEELKSRLTG